MPECKSVKIREVCRWEGAVWCVGREGCRRGGQGQYTRAGRTKQASNIEVRYVLQTM